uniref:tRNA (34-2'-O)-methyltransferase regulator WDR6 n=1 Tax=Meloidogyne hapla TaxID=6305 RepID=A0A1I8BQ34_MELHA
MSSSLFFGQRLCLEEFKEGKSKINSKGKIIFSGHGNTIEIYRFLHQKDCPSSFELLSTLNVFSSTKSSVQKIIFLENKALCCVGERECEILQLQEQKDENCLEFIVQQRFNLYYNDWLIGAKCVDGTGVVLHFATNSIKFIDLSNPSNIQTKCELSLKGRSVITCSLLDGDSWESLQIFAGTCFGPINQFWPAKNGEEILRTFEGNNGMSFAIRRHLNWLFSVGDDRSLRVWIIQGNGLQIFEKYGHGARPFALEIFEKHKTIFTGGVDEYLCIWRWTEDFNHKMLDLNLVKRIEFGSDSLGTIQCILPIFRNSINDFHLNLLISSRRGALVNIPLSDGHYSNKESKHIFEQVLNLNAFVVAEGKKSLHSLMLFALDEFRQLFVCQFSPASQKFPWTLNRLTSLSNKINSELLIDDKEFRPDLSIYSQKVQLLSVCSQNFLFILKVFPINKQIFDFSFVRFDGNFAQILWINSDSSIEDCCYLFALEYNGKATLFKCYSTGSCVIFNTFSMRPPTGRKSFPQSALLISSQKTKFSFELISFSKLNFEWPCEIIKNNGHSLIAGFQNSVPHSENITTLASLPLDGGENFFIVSGSLDRRIVCSSLNENKVFKINCSVQMHRSSVETICVLQENQNVTHNQEEGALAEPTYLILSGGGRSELFCCKLILNEENIPQFNLLFSAELKNENNIDDVRVLSVNWIFGKKFAVVLCSDATIRILHLNYLTKSINEFNRFQLSSLAMFCAMNLAKMIKGNDENYRYLFSVTSSGYLYIFKFLLTSNGTKIVKRV